MTLAKQLGDLADLTADELLTLWSRVEDAKRLKAVDPDLRLAIVKRCAFIKNRTAAEAIRGELEEFHPALVLENHWRELIPNRPALGSIRGAFPRRDVPEIPTPEDWIKDDPRRLVRVVHEMSRFTDDLKVITESVLALADSLGIDEEFADRVICSALRDRPKRISHVG